MSNTFDPTRLTATDATFLEEPKEYHELLAAKDFLSQLADIHLPAIIPIPGDVPAYDYHRATLTAFEILREHIIRDDSPFALNGEEGIIPGLEQIRLGVALRTGLRLLASLSVPPDFRHAVRALHLAQKNYEQCVARQGSDAPRPIRIWGGGSPRFNRYGKVLEFSDQTVAEFFSKGKPPIYYVDGKVTGLRLGDDGVFETGRIVVAARPPVIFLEDHHERTPELLVPDTPALLQAVAPEDDCEQYFNGELFYIPRGVPVFINTGMRHFAPLPLFSGMLTSPVVFRVATTTDAKDFHHVHFHFKRRVLGDVAAAYRGSQTA